jgi:hypothetical protein
MARRARVEFESSVEAARIGYIFARDGGQYRTWRSGIDARSSKALTSDQLEAAVMHLAQMFPGQVQRV